MKLDVKICGLKTEEAMAAALAGGATHVGFIFFEKSVRYIEPAEAGRLRKLAAGRAKVVAVTVDVDDMVLDAIVEKVQPEMLQLHGHESPERVKAIKGRYGIAAMKALPVRERSDLDAVEIYRDVADRLLFDAKPPKEAVVPGGRGVTFDWRLLEALDPAIDYMLSGGLNAGNIAEALAIARPSGIDISSGVESEPGIKTPELIAGFFAAMAALEKTRA